VKKLTEQDRDKLQTVFDNLMGFPLEKLNALLESVEPEGAKKFIEETRDGN
jgi:hypothetical protein